MAANLLPEDADRSNVFVSVFDYTNPQAKYVVPLEGSAAGGPGLSGAVTGEVVLVAGVATVPVASISAGSRVFLSRRLVGGTAGNMGYTKSNGVGFSITNSSATDTSTVEWMVVG